MISTYDWKFWDLFTLDHVNVPCIPGPWIVFMAKHWKCETDGKNASSPQNGIPWGDQVPFVPHTRRAGPSSSKPLQDKDGEGIAGQMIRLVAHLSQLYSAIVPSRASSSEGLNVTVLCAGAPGKPQPDPEAEIQRNL